MGGQVGANTKAPELVLTQVKTKATGHERVPWLVISSRNGN